jgi:hypothetical protein
MVWALDNRGNVYVREAVFPDFPVGISWVLVTGIEAAHLSIRSVIAYTFHNYIGPIYI